MHGWFTKLIQSRKTSSTQHKKGKVTENPVTSARSAPASPSPVSPSPRATPSETQRLRNAMILELRWRRKYDVFVCHSSAQTDIEVATRLVLFLEAAPCSLRCFLWHRDALPGGAVSTEFCQAVQNSHTRALLITPSFLLDDWCNYVMHQALAEGPMSNRTIPLLQNLSHSQYPQEMRFYYYIDLSKNSDRGFSMVHKAVFGYFENLVQKEMTCVSNPGCDSRCGVVATSVSAQEGDEA